MLKNYSITRMPWGCIFQQDSPTILCQLSESLSQSAVLRQMDWERGVLLHGLPGHQIWPL
jgi:hypothetical protein